MTTIQSGILVVEDDIDLAQVLVEELETVGFHADCVHSLAAARERIAARVPALILCDLRLGFDDGSELLVEIRGGGENIGFIMVTAFGTVQRAVASLKAGADDFVTKPIDFDQLLQCVDQVLERRHLAAEAGAANGHDTGDRLHGLLGRSPPMRKLFADMRVIAATDAPVLITGESGVGKELVAHALHLESNRRDAPFVPVNCAGIPGELMESEFFGHIEGAFTGASNDRKGLFASADGGTLFLDEIGEMPMELQAKLLRVLQDGSYRPVGSEGEMQGNVRVVAATNKDLEAAVASGEFREDLYYRLETFSLRVPPLRERSGDIPLLAARFAIELGDKYGKVGMRVGDDALEMLQGHDYPGNVRELRNGIERGVALSQAGEVHVSHLPARMCPDASARTKGSPGLESDNLFVPLHEVQRHHVQRVVEALGNKKEAAQVLGIARRTLYRYLNEAD